MIEIQDGHMVSTKFLVTLDKSTLNESTSEIQIPWHSLETRHSTFLYEDFLLKLPSKIEKPDHRGKRLCPLIYSFVLNDY